PISMCMVIDQLSGWCVLGCEFGEPQIMFVNDPLDPDKCRGREDLRCALQPDGTSLCMPSCGSDAQCPGRYCDLKKGFCVDEPPMGDPPGAKCDPQAMADTCAGLCVQLGGQQSMCTSPCTLGGVVPNPDECGGDGACVFSPQGTGLGDSAFCAQGCQVQDE